MAISALFILVLLEIKLVNKSVACLVIDLIVKEWLLETIEAYYFLVWD